MDFADGQVVAVPVALRPRSGGQLVVAAYRPGGQWPCAGLRQVESASAAAERLIRQVSGLSTMLPEWTDWSPAAEPVGFREDTDGLQLVMTAPVPATATLLENPGDTTSDWVQLAPWVQEAREAEDEALIRQELTRLDSVQHMVLDHWRQQVEETTAAFDLLPRYFTTTQVRAVYASLWGQQQDPGNFHKWLHTANAGVCKKVLAPEVQQRVASTVRRVWRGTAAEAEGLTMDEASKRFIGTSPLAFGALGVLTSVATAGAVAGGLVAYQATRAPGKQPVWYTRKASKRQVLRELYSPRPAWLLPGPIAAPATPVQPTAD